MLKKLFVPVAIIILTLGIIVWAQQPVNINNSIPAGSNVIGHVINDSGSTTAVTGNVAVTKADGSDVTLGAKADAKSAATDTTAITIMQVLKEISAMEQAPASRAVTNAGTFAVQEADGANTTLGAKADAKSTATDTTAITIMQVLKEISAMEQAPASRAVTNAGTFAVQATEADGANTTLGAKADAKSTATDTTAITVMQVLKEISAVLQAPIDQGLAATSTSGSAASGCYLISAASTNSTNCKNAAGNFYGVRAINTTATLYYLRMYNSSSAPTCSSATGFIESIPVPANTAGAGFMFISPIAINYGTGISFCFTGGSSSTDNTNAATGVFAAILYK